MKTKIFALFLIPALVFAATSPVLTLVETNGAPIDGSILSYSAQSESVNIKTQKGPMQRPLATFTAESQKQIFLWQADKDFLRDTRLVVDFQADYKSMSSNVLGTVTFGAVTKSNQVIGTATRSFYSCKIKLTNKSDCPFEEMKVDYRVYFTQYLAADFAGKYQLSGSADSAFLEQGSSWQFSTTPIIKSIIYQNAPTIRWSRQPYHVDSVIEGILLRVRKKDVTGEWVERQIEHGTVPRERDRRSYQKVYKSVYAGPEM